MLYPWKHLWRLVSWTFSVFSSFPLLNLFQHVFNILNPKMHIVWATTELCHDTHSYHSAKDSHNDDAEAHFHFFCHFAASSSSFAFVEQRSSEHESSRFEWKVTLIVVSTLAWRQISCKVEVEKSLAPWCCHGWNWLKWASTSSYDYYVWHCYNK